MTKELYNAIMKRSRYRNKFLKDKSQTSRERSSKNSAKLVKETIEENQKNHTLKALIQKNHE